MKEKIRMLKETKEGREKMCLIFEEIRNKGRQQEKIRNLKSIMEELHIDLEKAMLILEVPTKEREYYRKQLNQI